MTLRVANRNRYATSVAADPFQQKERARTVATLQSAAIFSDLPTAAIEDLANRVTTYRTRGGAAVVAQGDCASALYVLMAGRVKLVRFGENGREVTLSVLRAGEVFGEMSVFDSSSQSAHVVAIEPVTTLRLLREDFLSHLLTYPQTALAMLSEMSRRLRRAGDAIADLALCDVQDRLIRKLVLLANQDATEESGGLLIRRLPTQQDLANMVGSCRETISRTFNQLARRGLIVPTGRSLLVTHELLDGVRAQAKHAA